MKAPPTLVCEVSVQLEIVAIEDERGKRTREGLRGSGGRKRPPYKAVLNRCHARSRAPEEDVC